MNFSKEFLKQSQTIEVLEKGAEDIYDGILKGLNDAEIIEIIEPIRKDEQKHQRIMREIIDIISEK